MLYNHSPLTFWRSQFAPFVKFLKHCTHWTPHDAVLVQSVFLQGKTDGWELTIATEIKDDMTTPKEATWQRRGAPWYPLVGSTLHTTPSTVAHRLRHTKRFQMQ